PDEEECGQQLRCSSSLLTIAYDAQTGEQSWAARYKRTSGELDWASDLVINPSGDLAYVTGVVGVNGERARGVTIAYELEGDVVGEMRWLSEHDPHVVVSAEPFQS